MTTSVHDGDCIYFDNPATSFPKPPAVIDAVLNYMTGVGGNPGRSGHPLSTAAAEIVQSAREAIAGLFHVGNPMQVIFCSNATDALNLAIQGVICEGEHVITTSMEHNSTLRPLVELEQQKRMTLSIARCSREGIVDVPALLKTVTPETRVMVVNHASNVNGTVQPLREIGALCRERGIILIADCAQSAGVIDIDMKADGVGLLAFSGHKGLYGPTGTGGLVIADDFDEALLRPLKYGGTGSYSDKPLQPPFLPDRFESGTLNVAGISGLAAGVAHITAFPGGLGGIRHHKAQLVGQFLRRALREIEGFVVYAPEALIETGVVSFNIQRRAPSAVAKLLSDEYGIMCRSGLHCAPLAHQTMATFPHGTVRFGFGLFNREEEIDRAVDALRGIAGRAI